MLDAELLFNQALAARDSGNLPLAMDRLLRVIALQPVDAEARLILAEIRRELGRKAEAEAILVEGLRYPLDFDVALPLWLALADLRLTMGDAAGTARACHRILAQRPSHPEALYLLGNAFLDAGAYPEAMRAFGKALETDPFDAETWHNYGVTLEKVGAAEAAQEAFETWHRLSATPDRGPPPDFSRISLEDDG